MPVLAPRTVAAAKPSILTPALRQSFFDTRPTWGVCVLATVLNGGVNPRGNSRASADFSPPTQARSAGG